MRLQLLCGGTLLLLLGCNAHVRPSDDLKVTRAVLYQNGIGYFERMGKVHSQTLKLRIMPHQIKDVLKSLTVVDLGSGRAVNIALPVDKTQSRRLATLPPQVRNGGGLVSIARAFRGAQASVQAKDGSGSGRLVGVEQLSDSGDGWKLTILRDDGTLQSFSLAGVRKLRIGDRTLEVGLRKALDVSLDEGAWKPVELTIHLAGKLPHNLLVSYVVEMPTWKPAYRVVLTKGQTDGLLQGWAVVDNVSGEDWNKVGLSLTAGTPLTFTYDLYSPRYVRRPDLSPPQESMALAPPPPTDGAMAEEAAEMEDAGPVAGLSSRGSGGRRYKESKKMKRRSRSMRRPSAKSMPQPSMSYAPPKPAPRMSSKLLAKSFSALVKGARVGSLYRYDIEQPVTIRDRQSALVSILNKKVPAEDVLLYRMDTSSTYPYRSVRLKNTTGTLLESGPVAIYKDGDFVGEAVGGKVESNTSTFIPYSVDARVLVTLTDRTNDEGASLLRIVNGQFYLEVKRVAIHKYTVVNNIGAEATLYVQRRKNVGWKLIKPDKGVLTEKDHYFVPIKLAAKGKTEIEVREETPVHRWAGISSWLGRKAIGLYLKDPAADANISKALKEALELQDQVAKLDREISRLRRAKQDYSTRQDQVRANLKLLGKSIRNADLARKLTKTLLELEKKLNDLTRDLVSRDMKRSELNDRLTVLVKGISLEVKK